MKTELEPIFFKHEYNARGDEKVLRLLRQHGWAGYGLYWALVEKLYEANGRLKADYDHLAYDLRADRASLEAIITASDLFHLTKDGSIFGSRAVDRQLEKIRELSAKAKEAGRRSGAARRLSSVVTGAERPFNGPSTSVEQRREEKRREEGAHGALSPKGASNGSTAPKVARCHRCVTRPLEAGQKALCKACSWCSLCELTKDEPQLDPSDPQGMVYRCAACRAQRMTTDVASPKPSLTASVSPATATATTIPHDAPTAPTIPDAEPEPLYDPEF